MNGTACSKNLSRRFLNNETILITEFSAFCTIEGSLHSAEGGAPTALVRFKLLIFKKRVEYGMNEKMTCQALYFILSLTTVRLEVLHETRECLVPRHGWYFSRNIKVWRKALAISGERFDYAPIVTLFSLLVLC